ncbi:MAG: hypothetical protein R3D58_00910 [Saprospiraceae bacterium]
MSDKNPYQRKPWLLGLIWGWRLFAILNFIDYWNGELIADRLPTQFLIWTAGGLFVGYSRAWLMNWIEKKETEKNVK